MITVDATEKTPSLADLLRDLINNLLSKFIKIETITDFLTAIIMVIFWILVAYLTFKVVKLLLFKTKKYEKKYEEKETKEQVTVRRLINNIIRALFMFWIAIMILKELGIDIMPLLAGAGVLAFAVGFGAQEVIKDVLSGIFLIAEKTITIDDLVEINEIKGTVTDIGVRRTKIVTWKNEVVTYNNGDIRTVINHSVNPGLAVIEFNLDPKFDINLLYNKEFTDFLNNFKKSHPKVKTKPSLPVILDLNNAVTFRVTMETETRQHVGVEREFRKELYNYFTNKGITIEIPVIVGYLDNEK